jgi:hypothetical protein
LPAALSQEQGLLKQSAAMAAEIAKTELILAQLQVK